MPDSPRRTRESPADDMAPRNRATVSASAQELGTASSPPGLPVSFHPGAPFGRYRIERLLGEGAMGAVYLAHDTALERPVALKVPKFDSGDVDGRTRFLREARSAALLRHAHICPIHDVGEIDGGVAGAIARVR